MATTAPLEKEQEEVVKDLGQAVDDDDTGTWFVMWGMVGVPCVMLRCMCVNGGGIPLLHHLLDSHPTGPTYAIHPLHQ